MRCCSLRTADVLDGDGRLVRECLDQRDLVVGERPDRFKPVNRYHSEQLVTLEDRDAEHGPDRIDVFRRK